MRRPCWYLKHLRVSVIYLCFAKSGVMYWTEFYYQKTESLIFRPMKWYEDKSCIGNNPGEINRSRLMTSWTWSCDLFCVQFLLCAHQWTNDVICCLLLSKTSDGPLICRLLINILCPLFLSTKMTVS